MKKEKYDQLKKYICSKSNLPMQRVVGQLVAYNDIDHDDLIQEVAIAYWQEEPKNNLNSFIYNFLRRMLDKISKRIVTISYEELIEGNEQKLLSELLIEPTFNDLTPRSALLYEKVLDSHLLDPIDIEVLAGEMTRALAARELGISYDTYRRRLHRKLYKLRRINNE